MSTVTHIQALPNWQIVTVPSIDGPSAAPGIPKITYVQEIAPPPPPPPATLTMSITGEPGTYADGVVRSPDIPLPLGTTMAVLTAVFSVNEASLQFAQALEMGAKFTLADGTTLNGQFQFDYGKSATDMTLDLTSVSGSGWTPTPFVLAKFAPYVLHTVVAVYDIDDAAKKISIFSVCIDGKLCMTPTNMLRVPGKALGWAKNMLQTNFQPNTNPLGGNWQWTLINVNVELS